MCYITASGYKQELNRGVPVGRLHKNAVSGVHGILQKERGETVEPDEGAAGGEGAV